MLASMLALTCVCFAEEPAADHGASLEAASEVKTPYLLSDESLTSDPDMFWPGFLTGMEGFDDFHEPIGNPIYFESPFINTNAKFLYLHHEFDSGSVLMGGNLDVVALQLRLAITDRLAFIATKDGYSMLDATALPEGDGFNDVAAGIKYAFIVDEENDFVLTAGARYQFDWGASEVLQGTKEFSPFVSIAKGFGDFHFIGSMTYRLPVDGGDGNDIFQWDLHFDYELGCGLAPVLELHGLHYLDNGTAAPLPIGGLDYANLGSTMVSGNDVIWMGVGASAKLTPNLSVGATFEFALTDPEDDIMDTRFMFAATLTW